MTGRAPPALRRRRLPIRILRGAAIALAALLALACCATAAAVLALDTDWGRERLRRELETRLGALLDGTLSIGRITGSPLTRPRLDALALRGPGGRSPIVVGAVSLSWSPLALLGKRFEVREAVIDRPVVRGTLRPDGALDLARLLREVGGARPAAPPGRSSSWTLTVDRAVVRDGALVLPIGKGTSSLGDLELEAALRLEGGRFELTVGRLAARWGETAIALTGRLVRTPGLTAFSDLDLRGGGSRAQVSQAGLSDGGALEAAFEVEAAAGDLERIAPGAAIAGDISLGGTVNRAGAGQPLAALLHGRALRGELSAALSVDPAMRSVHGVVQGRDLVSPAGPPARASFQLAVDLTGFTAETAEGTLRLDARGAIAGQRVDRLHLGAAIAGGVVSAEGTVRAGSASAGLRGRLRLRPALFLETARLHAALADLRSLRPLLAGLGGAATLDLSASGPIRALGVRGWLRATDPSLGPARAASAQVDFDLRGLPARPTGSARLALEAAVVRASPVGSVRVEVASDRPRSFEVTASSSGAGAAFGGSVAARVTLEPAAVRIALGPISGIARGLAFSGRGGEVVIGRGGAIRVQDLSLTSAAGALLASGAFAVPRAGRRPLPDERLTLRLTGVDLARLRAAFGPDLPPIAGTLDLELTVLGQGAGRSAEARITGSALVVRSDLPAVDLSLRADAGRGRLVASGEVRGRDVPGTIDLALDAAIPADLLDLAAWRRFALRDPRHGGRIAFRDLDLALVARLAHRAAGLEGEAAGTLAIAPGDRVLRIDLAVRQLGLPPVRGVDVAVHGSWSREELRLAGTASLAGQPAISFAARAGAGLDALLGGLDPRGVALGVHLEAKALPLQALQAAVAAKSALAGSLDLTADLSGTAAAPLLTGKLALAQASIGGVSFESFAATLEGDAARLELTVSAQQGAEGLLDAAASLDRKDASASRLRLKATRFDLAFLAALAHGRGSQLASTSGILDADVTFAPAGAGDPAPSVKGRIKLSDGKVYLPSSGPIDHLELEATVDGGHLVVERLTGKNGGGTVTAKLDANLLGLLPHDFTAEIGLDTFPVLAGVRVVKVTTTAALSGGVRADGVLAVVASLEGTRIHVPTDRRSGAALQGTHASRDVVFVDGRDGATPPPAGAPDQPLPASLEGLRLRLELVTPSPIELTGPDLDLFLRQRLVVTLGDGQVAISGGIEAERGFVQLFGARWEVSTANLSFDPRGPPDPRIDLLLTREFRTTTVFVGVTGTLGQPKLSLRADPGSYDQAQILSWVLGGSPDDAAAAAPALGSQAVGVASNMLLGPIQDQIRALVPFDVLAVQVGEGADTQTTRVQVGKWLTESLLLGYRARLNSPDATKNQNEANIEWRFARRWYLEAFYGDRGAGGADAIWSLKY